MGAAGGRAAHQPRQNERLTLEGQLCSLRAAMQGVLESQGVKTPAPKIGESWLVRTAIVSARIELEEIGARYLRGYGDVPATAAETLDQAADELLGRLDLMEAFLPVAPAPSPPSRE